jgi:hypothetical protein
VRLSRILQRAVYICCPAIQHCTLSFDQEPARQRQANLSCNMVEIALGPLRHYPISAERLTDKTVSGDSNRKINGVLDPSDEESGGNSGGSSSDRKSAGLKLALDITINDST